MIALLKKRPPAEPVGLWIERRNGRTTLHGYAAVFRADVDLPPFAPGAFKHTIDSGKEVFATYNHNCDLLLGRRSNGTLRLWEDAIGLRYEVDLPDTSTGRDVLALVERGDVRGSSVVFGVVQDRQAFRDGESVLEITDCDLHELGPVYSPACKATERANLQRRSATLPATRTAATTENPPEPLVDVMMRHANRLDRMADKIDAVIGIMDRMAERMTRMATPGMSRDNTTPEPTPAAPAVEVANPPSLPASAEEQAIEPATPAKDEA